MNKNDFITLPDKLIEKIEQLNEKRNKVEWEQKNCP